MKFRYGRLFKYAARQTPALSGILALTVVAAGAAALQPWPLKILVDYGLLRRQPPPPLHALLEAVSSDGNPGTIILIASLAGLVILLLSHALNNALAWAWTSGGQRLVRMLAADLYERFLALSLRYHQRNPVGDSLERLTTDSWCVYGVADLIVGPAHQVLTLATLGAVAWTMNRELAIYAMATAPLTALATVYFGGRLKRRTRLSREAQSRLSSFVQQTLVSIPAVQAFATEERNRRHFQDLASEAVTLSRRGAVLNSRFGLATGLTTTAATAVILFAGGRQVLAGTLSLGSFLVFLSYIRSLQAAAESLLKTYSSLKAVQVSMDRVLEVFESDDREAPELPSGPPPAPRARQEGLRVELDGVVFGYEPEIPILREISIEALPGQTLALVGPTGAGKSTLVSLIPRFIDPWEGRVLIDGRDAREYPIESLRGQIAVVLQEPFLFPRSVLENIAYGRPGAARAEIEAAAAAANADTFIRRLPQGYDTVLGERGATLSGGERQRLSIARAFLKDAPILILDEPTSALDTQTEADLLDALARLRERRTTFIVAHRLSTVRAADRIILLADGRIQEAGTHEALLRIRGTYHRYYTLQSQGAVSGGAA